MIKKAYLAAFVSAALLSLVPSTILAQRVKPNVTCPDCDPDGGDGGGGSGGGGTTPFASNLSWTLYANTPYPTIGGVGDREGFGAAIFNHNLYVAYTQAGSGDQPVYINQVNDSGNLPGGNYSYVNPTGGSAYSNANPNLVAGGGNMFLVLNNASRNTGIWKYNGSGWDLYGSLPTSSDYSPGAAISDDGSTLYIGLRATNVPYGGNGPNGDETMTICRVSTASFSSSCSAHPGTQKLLFNPELAYWNGTLYAAFAADDGSHTVKYFTSTDGGQTLTAQSGASSDQASISPKLVIYNGALYMGFRSNDSSQRLITKYTTDGVNWSSSVNTCCTTHSVPMMVNNLDNGGTSIQRPNWIVTLFTNSNKNLVEYVAQ